MFSDSYSSLFSEQNHRSQTQAVLRRSSRLGHLSPQRGRERGGAGKRGSGDVEERLWGRSLDLKDVELNMRILDSPSVDWSTDFQRIYDDKSGGSDTVQFPDLLKEALEDGEIEEGREKEVSKRWDNVGTNASDHSIDTFSDMDDDIDKDQDDKVEKEVNSRNISNEMTKKIKNSFGTQEIIKVKAKKMEEVMFIDSFTFTDHEKVLDQALRSARSNHKTETEEPSTSAPRNHISAEKEMKEKAEKNINQRLAAG